MKIYLLVVQIFIHAFLFGQSEEQFVIQIDSFSIPNLPGLQSYSWGKTSDEKWVLLGGRVDGLHQRQPFASFLDSDNNNFVYVVDPINEMVWSQNLSVLPISIFEQLRSTNQNFTQKDHQLIVIGGYGFSPTANDHITFPNLTLIDLDGLANAVINNQSIVSFFRQITDSRMKVTGGQLGIMDQTFFLVGGQLFDGRYNPMGPNNGPGFVQQYTNDIRSFEIDDDGVNVSIMNYQAVHDTVNLHRRDYNMAPQIFPNGSAGFTVFSGVFNYNNMPYLNSVDINSNLTYLVNNTFNQFLSQYQSPKLPIYDTNAHVMHTLFFGGISQYQMVNGNLVEDVNVPFVKTISKVTRNSNGTMSEVDLGYIQMPALLGAGAEFIPIDNYYYSNEVLNLNAIPNNQTLIGYIFGGIESSANNIFFNNDGSQSNASSKIFRVYINKSLAGTVEETPIYAGNVIRLKTFPNPVKKKINLEFYTLLKENVSIEIMTQEGKIVHCLNYKVEETGFQKTKINVEELSDGMYILRVHSGTYVDQCQFIKE